MFTQTELAELLGRPIRRLLTRADRAAFAGRCVLVTGAGGSIGSELARQLAACAPKRLTLVDQSELNLFQVERGLAEVASGVPFEIVLADVTRRESMRRICRNTRPDVVYHAAAYKHVAMLEGAVCAAAHVNVIGTASVAHAARAAGARLVLVSSDKAASPRSVMGATKRLAEIVALSRPSRAPRAIVVRFGNVLASSGSVLTIMRDAVRRGQPVPVTDPRASRYFMTAGEAVALLMKADLLGRSRGMYWLDMGRPVEIGDLAERLIALERRAGYARMPIDVVGLKPGERLREEPATRALRMTRTSHPRIWRVHQPGHAWRTIDRRIAALARSVDADDAAGVLDRIAGLVPEFRASREARDIARRQSADLEKSSKK